MICVIIADINESNIMNNRQIEIGENLSSALMCTAVAVSFFACIGYGCHRTTEIELRYIEEGWEEVKTETKKETRWARPDNEG